MARFAQQHNEEEPLIPGVNPDTLLDPYDSDDEDDVLACLGSTVSGFSAGVGVGLGIESAIEATTWLSTAAPWIQYIVGCVPAAAGCGTGVVTCVSCLFGIAKVRSHCSTKSADVDKTAELAPIAPGQGASSAD